MDLTLRSYEPGIWRIATDPWLEKGKRPLGKGKRSRFCLELIWRAGPAPFFLVENGKTSIGKEKNDPGSVWNYFGGPVSPKGGSRTSIESAGWP